jgi:GTPase SAR1 family protein
MNIFDLSGDDVYKLTRQDFYADSQAVLLCFDVGRRETFLSLAKWEREMKEFGVDFKRAFIAVVGNKADVKTRVGLFLANNAGS